MTVEKAYYKFLSEWENDIWTAKKWKRLRMF
jgi:hypothetical protein